MEVSRAGEKQTGPAAHASPSGDEWSVEAAASAPIKPVRMLTERGVRGRKRIAEIGPMRELNSRVFHAAFYTEDELEQVAALISFDHVFYQTEYPGVAATGLEAIRHFLTHGVNEGRVPSSPASAPTGDWLAYLVGFDAAYYADIYPDTAPAVHDHFIRHGARERRLPFNLHDNLTSEQLLLDALDTLGLSSVKALEEPTQHEATSWIPVPEILLTNAERNGIIPKRYRNNYWLGMAVGFLAQCRFGAAVCCYNFFFNYYVPVSFLGNADHGIVGAGCIFTTKEGIARTGTLVASPRLARSVVVSEPVFLNRPNRSLPPSRLHLPKPVYGTLQNVEAIGGTSLMVQDGHVVLYDYVDYGERPRELQSPSLLHIVGQNCSFRLPAKTMELNEAFSFLHDHGNNYHHWLLEILPRYLLARQNGLPEQTPLLVERDMAPQMREILREVCHDEPALVEVTHGASVQVKRLHFVTDLCVNTVHTKDQPERDDILFSPSAIEMLRELASPHFASGLGKFENVFVVRQNVTFRRLINQDLLLKAMKAMGLWNFDPGNAAWAEQVRVFSNAKLIVAEAGAAMANLVFCRPGTNVIILVNGHKNSNFFYLTQLAGLVGAHLYFFECLRLKYSHAIEVQDDMIAPVSQLAEWIRRFLADPAYRAREANVAVAPKSEVKTRFSVSARVTETRIDRKTKKRNVGGRVH